MAEATMSDPVKRMYELHPKFAAASTKLQELCARRDEVGKAVGPLREKLARAHVLGSIEQTLPKPAKAVAPQGPSEAARELLGDVNLDEHLIETAPPPPRSQHPDLPEFERLGEELHALTEAINVIRDRKKGARYSLLEREHLQASQLYCDEIRPEYEALARSYCEALVALGQATTALHDFEQERLRGASWATLKPIAISELLGNPEEPTSELRRILAWAVEMGHFPEEKMPDRWVKRRRESSDIHSWPERFRGIKK